MSQNNLTENAPALSNAAAAIPSWLTGKGKVDEKMFCDEFISQHSLSYFNDRFYNIDGEITDDIVKFMIF